MLSHRNQSAHALYLFSIDAGGDEPYGIGSTRDRVTPGIADKRVTITRALFSIGCGDRADLSTRNKVGLSLNRTSPGQNLPMVLSGLKRKCCRKDDDVTSRLLKLKEELEEADVITNGTADLKAINLVGDYFRTGLY